MIGQRIGRWTRFAFKSPDLAPFLPLLIGTLPNPIFIVATRNVFESSFGFASYVGGKWHRSYFAVTFLQACLTLFTLLTRRPVLCFSYETALKDPEHFVDVLCSFLHIEPDSATRQCAIDHVDGTSGYRLLRRTNGHVDIATRDRVAGWVADAMNLDKGVGIEVRDSTGVIAIVMANGDRPDVKEAGFHRTGTCGFDVTFDPPLSEKQSEELSVTVSKTGHEIWTASRGNQ